jgi:tRNA1(Val) A37 N6-methylase TrmN6
MWNVELMQNSSTINQHFTFNYSQPVEYRFSQDSVFLARRVFELCTPIQVPHLRVLDLCAGCGIIGLEFIFHCQKEFGLAPQAVDFLEIQEVYQPHFEINLERLSMGLSLIAPKLETTFRFINKNYDCLKTENYSEKYNLILCNPPYFFANQGLLSPSEFKNRCRFFIDSDFKNLLMGIAKSLTSGGQAYLLLRDLSQHKWNSLQEAEKILQGQLSITTIGDIRSTHFVRLDKA